MHDELSASRRKPLPGQEAVSFESFLRSHSPTAYKFACQAFGAATAHDICQEAWIELRHGWGAWPGKPVVWLYKLLLRHIGRWQEAQRRLAEEPAFSQCHFAGRMVSCLRSPSDARRSPLPTGSAPRTPIFAGPWTRPSRRCAERTTSDSREGSPSWPGAPPDG